MVDRLLDDPLHGCVEDAWPLQSKKIPAESKKVTAKITVPILDMVRTPIVSLVLVSRLRWSLTSGFAASGLRAGALARTSGKTRTVVPVSDSKDDTLLESNAISVDISMSYSFALLDLRSARGAKRGSLAGVDSLPGGIERCMCRPTPSSG